MNLEIEKELSSFLLNEILILSIKYINFYSDSNYLKKKEENQYIPFKRYGSNVSSINLYYISIILNYNNYNSSYTI